MLYVDDGAFVFELRHQLETGTPLLLRHFEKFGLEMHIGKENKPSKTECVFFPTPGYFILPNLPNSDASTTTSSFLTDKVKQENDKKKCQREDGQYDNSTDTAIVKFKEGNVTFTRHFKYLGSYISYNLRNDHDVDSRIAAASASMVSLSRYWSDKSVDIKSKYLIFVEIPCNILFWGSEIWALRTSLLSNLEVFLHRSVRRFWE